MSYNGWRLDDQSKTALLDTFPPRFVEVIAHHVTLKHGNRFCPQPVSAQVVGYAADLNGIECLVVAINGCIDRPDGKIFHITWSLDREAGFKPVSSNALLENGFTPVEPITITVTPFFKDHDGQEWTKEVIDAVDRCRAEGHEDPFFVGSKGYPNWMDFTDAAIAKTRAFVAETQRLVKPSSEG